MTDPTHPDAWGLKPGNNKQTFKVVHPPTEAEMQQLGRAPTDVEAVAGWLSLLRYGDMKKVAAGILGADAKPEEIGTLADKIHEWSEKAALR
jgi:hypothetical protein